MKEKSSYVTPDILLLLFDDMDIITTSGSDDGNIEENIPEDKGENDGEWMTYEW